MLLGIQITSYTDRKAVIEYVQSFTIMPVKYIDRALDIDGYIFYSSSFSLASLSTAPFTYTPIEEITGTDVYLNVAGNKLEVPYDKDGEAILFRELEVSGYFLDQNFHPSVIKILDVFVANKYLKKLTIVNYFIPTENSIILQEDGYLVFYNNYDPEFTLYIDENGDLIADGNKADKYSINEQGYLIFTE